MKLFLFFTLLCAATGIGTIAAADLPKDSKGPTSRPATQPALKAINKYCAVDTDQEIDPDVTYIYNGKVIGFCCSDCIPKFKKDPEKYMKHLK